jgi:hypothetical protein
MQFRRVGISSLYGETVSAIFPPMGEIGVNSLLFVHGISHITEKPHGKEIREALRCTQEQREVGRQEKSIVCSPQKGRQ